MTMASSEDRAGGSPCPRPHMVLLPSAGMGHLAPFTRLATTLSSAHACDVSLVTALPTVSSAESDHLQQLFTASPAIRQLDFHLTPFDASEFSPDADPFYLRYEAMRRSAPLKLAPLLAAAGASALVADISLASVAIPVANEIGLPCHVFFTVSATMFSFYAYFPTYLDAAHGAPGDADVPGVCRVPKSSFPQALHDGANLFTQQFVANGRSLCNADGLLVNSFDDFEPEAVAALRHGSVTPGLSFPPVYTVGPLSPASSLPPAPREAARASSAAGDDDYMAWLDAQPERSVVYVSFGSRKALPRDQMRELADGLEASGCRFLWVVKGAAVDRDDDAALGDLLGGGGFLQRVQQGQRRGLVTKAWVEQGAVLKHPAVGVFVSHCGWNSLTEAAASGVPVLAWPRFADQRVNAGVVARRGVGVWVEEWSWEGEERAVTAAEIAEKVRSVMADEALRTKSVVVREAAARAVATGGTSYRSLAELVRRCCKASVSQ